MSRINFYFLEYAFAYIKRYKTKNIFIGIVFTLLVFLLSSLFFITTSIEHELNARIATMPDMVVKNYKAGIVTTTDEKTLQKLLEIDGITSGRTRIYGNYSFTPQKRNFEIVGVDLFEDQDDPLITHALREYDLNDSAMLVSKNVAKSMKKAYYTDYFNFILPSGKLDKVMLGGTFATKGRGDRKDLILMTKEGARKVFGFASDEASDIALDVANRGELAFLAEKIRLMLPNAKVITRDDLKLEYKNIFDYYGGIFLALFVIALFTFFIIVYDKANGLSSEEKREIGILKAIGWRIEDVLAAKFYEAGIIAFFSFVSGVLLAALYVFVFKAPILADIFLHDTHLRASTFMLAPHIDYAYILLIFLLSVPLYIAAILIPSWRVATLDADEVMR